MRRNSFVAIGMLIRVFGSVEAVAEEMTLIGPDQSAPIIVISAEATVSEKYAAEEMASHLKKMTGRAITITKDQQQLPTDTKLIAIGRSSFTSQIDVSGLDVEQYVIDVQPNRLVIIGGRQSASPGQHVRDAGTLFGVYEFLEGLGVRWYRPEPWGEHVPRMKELKLRIGRTTSLKPSYSMRAALSGGMSYSREETPEENRQARVWAVRNRTNAWYSSPDRAVKFGGVVEHSKGKHNWPFLIPASEYFDEHPEYFALVDGERVPYDLCPGNAMDERDQHFPQVE